MVETQTEMKRRVKSEEWRWRVKMKSEEWRMKMKSEDEVCTDPSDWTRMIWIIVYSSIYMWSRGVCPLIIPHSLFLSISYMIYYCASVYLHVCVWLCVCVCVHLVCVCVRGHARGSEPPRGWHSECIITINEKVNGAFSYISIYIWTIWARKRCLGRPRPTPLGAGTERSNGFSWTSNAVNNDASTECKSDDTR